MIDHREVAARLVDQVRLQFPQADLQMNSRDIRPGDVFVAVPGLVGDGRDYIADAVAKGAVGVIYEAPLSDGQQVALQNVPGWGVTELKGCLGQLAHQWWQAASDALTVIAVTGTNGKTTTTQWLAAALNNQGHRCGVIGTLGVRSMAQTQGEGGLTTPDVISIHRHLYQMQREGVTHVVMEASSIGLEQGRLDAVSIDVAVFTNLTQDHLDYHADMQAYANAKALLFKRPGLKCAVINADDAYASWMRSSGAASTVFYSAMGQQADVSADRVVVQAQGQQFELHVDQQGVSVRTPFAGAHSIANLLAVASVLHVLGWTPQAIAVALEQLPPVSGRLEPVEPIGQIEQPPHGDASGTTNLGPYVVVDYAHTPDALANVLGALRPMAKARGGDLWVVVGCGGNRDASKRPLMAAVAEEAADRLVLTSDNPRNEDPVDILDQMLSGIQNPSRVTVESDRALAILGAIWQAKPQDVVLLAGKGHEDWQEIAGERLPFDDRQWARLALLFVGTPPEVQTDTRALRSGALFIALPGERFDGHDYLAVAREAGAVAAVVSHVVDDESLAQVHVHDTRLALQTLAKAWRRLFDIPLIGVTGSNGKTTTKEMTAVVCRAWVGSSAVLSTQGNLNNELGVPLTLLRLRAHHQVAVIEMGMNHPGEIALLADIAQPTVGLVLNAQREHQEFMKSVDAVANENADVLRSLPANGVAVYPAGDQYTTLWHEAASHVSHHLSFGRQTESVVQVLDCHLDAAGSTFTLRYHGQSQPARLAIAGQHNIINASAAVSCAVAAGAPFHVAVKGLSEFQAVKGRLQVHQLPCGQTLVDDTYNANPDSVLAAIDVLTMLPAPRALVLGDMGEVGDEGPQMHAEIGQYAHDRGIDYLWVLGQATQHAVAAFGPGARWFESPQQLCEQTSDTSINSLLVKGSRFMGMERVVNWWLNRAVPASRNEEAQHVS